MSGHRLVETPTWIVVVALSAWLPGCTDGGQRAAQTEFQQIGGVPMTIRIVSGAFEANGPIPERYTADGENVSPPLSWSELPQGTQQLALIVDDPDAPRSEPFVHWVIYGIPATAEGLAEGIAPDRMVSGPVKAKQGVNGFGELGYGGPAPPKGHGTHH